MLECTKRNRLRYYNLLRLLKDLPGAYNMIISFDALMSRSVNEMGRVSRFLKLIPDPAGLSVHMEVFLEKQLKHHNINDGEIKQYNKDYDYVFELYDRMKQYDVKDRFSNNVVDKLLDGMPNDTLLKY